MVGEQIGFDEGGVFESLRDPVWSIRVTETKYRHNKDGLVTSETVTETFKQVTGTHILAAALGPALLALIAKIGDLEDDQVAGLIAGMPFGIIGSLLGYKAAGIDVPTTEEATKWITGWISKLIGAEV